MMNKSILGLLLLFSNSLMMAQGARPAGINLAGVTDYSTELVFTDAFRQCREWTVHGTAPNAAWDSGLSVPLNAQGYPLELPYSDGVNPPQIVRALMLWDINQHYPAGNYRLIVSGTGQVRLWGAASGTFQCPVDVMVPVNPAQGGVVLELEQSSAADPLHDIHFVYPDYTQIFQNQTFTTDLLVYVYDFQTIRFMDFLRTNGSTVTSWNERTPADYYTQTKGSGVAWEFIIELCNLTHKNAWINIPHQADDDYIQHLAEMLRDQLDPALKIYLEYSNEVWNSQFSQNAYAANAAAALGYTGQPWERTWKYTAKRSADIFYTFETVFGNSDRLVKVVPSQAANSWLSNQILTFFEDPLYNPHQVSADVLAIAPYFGGSVGNQLVNDGIVSSVSIPEILQRAAATQPEAFGWMDQNKTVADNHGLQLMAYEAGQHLVGTGNNVNNDTLTAKLNNANRHPDMKSLYCQYVEHWYESTQANLMCFFSSHGQFSKWGSWGMKEYMEDFSAPKYRAMQDCVFPFQSSSAKSPTQEMLQIFPNPSPDGVFYVKGIPANAQVEVFDMLGRQLPVKTDVFEDKLSIRVPAQLAILKVESLPAHLLIRKGN